jgi:hypothetical protein
MGVYIGGAVGVLDVRLRIGYLRRKKGRRIVDLFVYSMVY